MKVIDTEILKCMVLNCQSLSNKVDSIMDFICENKVDVCFLNETWLKSLNNDTCGVINAYPYDLYHSDTFGRCKGVAFILKKSKCKFVSKEKTFPEYTSFDCLSLTLTLNNTTGKNTSTFADIKLVCLYRYHGFGSYFNSFLQDFSNLLSNLTTESSPFLIAGDFNVHWNKPCDYSTRCLKDLIDEFNVVPIIPSGSTHIRGNTLDIILSSLNISPYLNSLSCQHVPGIGDHFPLLFSLACSTNTRISNSSTIKEYRNLKSLDMSNFKNSLSSSLLSSNFFSIKSSDCNSFLNAMTTFNKCIS